MKAVHNFLSYVEISTKIASVFPFLVGVGYALYRYGTIQVKQTLVFFLAMLLFDMTTTAINNHIGHRQTGRAPHYSGAVSIGIILTMGLLAAALGIYLVSISSIVVLWAGMLCFGMGIIYSFGLLPIARTPFGELSSGTVMGIGVPFIAVEISHSLITFASQNYRMIIISADWVEIVSLGVVVAPLICCISNIMLANNICDVEEDVQVKRYTLPFYIGVKKALRLYRLLYIAAFGFILIGSVMRIVPVFTVAVLLSAPLVGKNIKKFTELQDKGKTFFTAILNFLTIIGPYAACIWLGCVRYLV